MRSALLMIMLLVPSLQAMHIANWWYVPERDEPITKNVWQAVSASDARDLRRWLNSGESVDSCDEKRYHLAHKAARLKTSTVMQELIQHKAHLEAADWFKWTPIFHAVDAGSEQNIKVLADAKANLEAQDWAEETPLMLAVQLPDRSTIISQLIAAKANVNAVDHQGKTALMFATLRNHPEYIALLLNAGANRNHKSIIGKTAYDWSPSDEITQLLIGTTLPAPCTSAKVLTKPA